MVNKNTIIESIPKCLKTVNIVGSGRKFRGKVRDYYITGDKRIMITTDRQSAFDVNLGYIPFKGAVLNQLSAFWFAKTKHIVKNHLITVTHPNVMIVRNCKPIPIEMIVRGFISGVTKTSIWYSYSKGERLIYGLTFPDGLRKNQQLPKPVITPTTHGGGKGGHDERLTKEEIIKRRIVDKKLYEQMEKAALALFHYGSRLCMERGLILVDTKYEFGLYNGKLTLMDEIHTPDSSRFWIEKTYLSRFEKGQEPENYDKEFLRLWYKERGFSGEGKPPEMTGKLIVDLAKRYVNVYEILTGKIFKPYKYPINDEIAKTLKRIL